MHDEVRETSEEHTSRVLHRRPARSRCGYRSHLDSGTGGREPDVVRPIDETGMAGVAHRGVASA